MLVLEIACGILIAVFGFLVAQGVLKFILHCLDERRRKHDEQVADKHRDERNRQYQETGKWQWHDKENL